VPAALPPKPLSAGLPHCGVVSTTPYWLVAIGAVMGGARTKSLPAEAA
jgi:hypothetical protein